MKTAASIFAVILMCCVSGCGSTPTPDQVQAVMSSVTFSGLTAASVEAPDTAKADAALLKSKIEGTVLPAIKITSSFAGAMSIVTANVGGSIIGNTVLNSIELAVQKKLPLLIAAIQGVDDGVNEFLTPAQIRPKWRDIKVSFEKHRTTIQMEPLAEIVELPPIHAEDLMPRPAGQLQSEQSGVVIHCRICEPQAACATCGGSWTFNNRYYSKPCEHHR